MKGFVYLATPYSHPDPSVRLDRYKEAVKFLRWCLWRRDWAYAPIVHTHDAALGGGLPYEYEFWHDYNTEMITLSRGIFILTISGWRESRGIAAEVLLAEQIGRPVTYFGKSSDMYVPLEQKP